MNPLTIIIILIPPALILDGIRRLIIAKRADAESREKKFLRKEGIAEIIFGVLFAVAYVCLMLSFVKVFKGLPERHAQGQVTIYNS